MHSQSRQIPFPARLEEVLLYECVKDVYTSHDVYKACADIENSQNIFNFEITVSKWKKLKRLEFLGIPTYWGSGLAENNGTRYDTRV